VLNLRGRHLTDGHGKFIARKAKVLRRLRYLTIQFAFLNARRNTLT